MTSSLWSSVEVERAVHMKSSNTHRFKPVARRLSRAPDHSFYPSGFGSELVADLFEKRKALLLHR